MPENAIVVQQKRDWLTPVIMASGVAILGYGVYLFLRKQKEGIPYRLTIASYQNTSTGIEVEAPDMLDIEPGDSVKINFKFNYYGPSKTVLNHGALWRVGPVGDVNEVASNDETLSIPTSSENIVIEGSVTVDTKATWTPEIFGLFLKMGNLPGTTLEAKLADVIRVGSGIADEWVAGQIIGNGHLFTAESLDSWHEGQIIGNGHLFAA